MLRVVHRQVECLFGASVWREGNLANYSGKFIRKRGIQRIFDASTAVAAFLFLKTAASYHIEMSPLEKCSNDTLGS